VRRHIVITGPGRSGTTLLVQLFAQLGFETGGRLRPFTATVNAGLEDDILDPVAPYVVKNPDLSWQLADLLTSGQLSAETIEWLVVPLRELGQATASRVRTTVAARDIHAPGGLVRTPWPSKQRQHLAETNYALFETAALFELPLIVLHYPRFATDHAYAYRRLRPLLADRTEAAFTAALEAVVNPALVNDAPIQTPRFVTTRVAAARLRRAAKVGLARAGRRR
jgi:hypothetical protein